jgi:hypothetical protein
MQASRLEAVSSLATSLGISSLVLAAIETADNNQPEAGQHRCFSSSVLLTQSARENFPLAESPVDMSQRRPDETRTEEPEEVAAASPPPMKRARLAAAAVPMLHSLLSQLPLQPQQLAQSGKSEPGSLKLEEGEEWGEAWEQRLGMAGGLGGLLHNPNHQLANLLTAAAKLKQVAEKAMRKLNFFYGHGVSLYSRPKAQNRTHFEKKRRLCVFIERQKNWFRGNVTNGQTRVADSAVQQVFFLVVREISQTYIYSTHVGLQRPLYVLLPTTEE